MAVWQDAKTTAALDYPAALAPGKIRRILLPVMNAHHASTTRTAATGGLSLRAEISSGTNRTIAVRV